MIHGRFDFLDAYERTGIPVLIGNRMANTHGMPIFKKWTNRFLPILKSVNEGLCCRPALRISFYRSDILPFIMSSEQRFAFEFDVLLRARVGRFVLIQFKYQRFMGIISRAMWNHFEMRGWRGY